MLVGAFILTTHLRADEESATLVNGFDTYELSLNPLKSYCDTWAKSYKPKTDEELNKLEPLVSDVYEIFEDFWTPSNVQRLFGDREEIHRDSRNYFYQDAPYFILQRSVLVALIETDEGISIDTGVEILNLTGEDPKKIIIKDFRPQINFEKQKVLHLTEDREKSLLAFLGYEIISAGSYNKLRMVLPKEKSRMRERYLAHYLRFVQRRSGGWYMISHPEAQRILINSRRTEAHVEFQFLTHGGKAIYKKENGKWILKGSRMTWVQ